MCNAKRNMAKSCGLAFSRVRGRTSLASCDKIQITMAESAALCLMFPAARDAVGEAKTNSWKALKSKVGF